jgi:hypothetical protein
MLFIFQVGVKIDPSIVWKSGKRALVVGILGFFIPFALASFVRLLLCHSISLDDTVCHVLQLVVLMLKLKLNPEGQGRQPPTDQPQQPATSRSRQPPPRLQPPTAFTLEG